MKKSFFLLICVQLLLSGCVGAGFLVSYSSSKTDEYLKSKDELVKSQGKPIKVNRISDFEEVLVYKSDSWNWIGIMPYISIGIPIPIPLFISTGYKTFEYHVRNDMVFEIVIKQTSQKNCFTGYGLINEASSNTKFYFECDR